MAIAKDNIRITITMSRDLKAELDKLAKEDNRTFGNYVVTVLQRHTEENREAQIREFDDAYLDGLLGGKSQEGKDQ